VNVRVVHSGQLISVNFDSYAWVTHAFYGDTHDLPQTEVV
jgi:hypothetical protein